MCYYRFKLIDKLQIIINDQLTKLEFLYQHSLIMGNVKIGNSLSLIIQQYNTNND